MRRVASLLAIALALTAPPAAAVAAPTGVIRGVVVNESTGKPQPRVRITLSGAKEDGSEPTRRTAVTDDRGRYSFDSLLTGKDRIYTVDALYEGGFFAGRALSLPADTAAVPVIDTRMRVWNTTSNPAVILIRRNDVFAIPRGNEVAVIESATVVNQSEEAYIGRGAGGPGRQPGASLGFGLPAGARTDGVAILDSTIDLPRIVPTDFGFGLIAAIPPGETRATFSYRVEGAGGIYDLSRTALYPTVKFSVFAQRPLDVRSNRLRRDGEVKVGSKLYRRWSTTSGLDSGDPVQVSATAQAGLSPGLVAGVGAAGAVLAGAIGVVVARRRRGRRARGTSRRPELSREDLLVEIARLDLEYESGDLARPDWEKRRAELKGKLEHRDASRGEPEAAR